jgi:hypothetical protein
MESSSKLIEVTYSLTMASQPTADRGDFRASGTV